MDRNPGLARGKKARKAMTPEEEGLRVQIEGYRRMTPQERLQISFRLYVLT
jgi:hypothetical protein